MGLTLVQIGSPLASSEEQLRILGGSNGVPLFEEKLAQAGLSPLAATGITVFQINVGRLCNQTCGHCHVDAGPGRREVMSRETAEACIRALAKTDIPTVDITGGAPELNLNWDGALYDCDFNQMLDLPVSFGAPRNIRDFDLATLARRRILTGNHCYGCTAGAGSIA